MSVPEKVVIFLPNWVGDVVMATPALRAIRAQMASAEITLFGGATAVGVLDGLGWADRTLLDESRRRPGAWHFLRTARRLRRERFDLAVLMPNSLRTAALARLGGCRRRVGYDRDGRGWLLSEKLQPPRDEAGQFRPVPMIDYYLALAERLGATGASRQMQLGVTAADEAEADAIFAEAGIDRGRPVVMLNPGAAFGPSKMWPAERYAAVADALIERRGGQVIVNAAPNEKAIAARVVEAMRNTPAVSFGERDNTIGLLKALMRRCDLLITNDTGARHFAAALGAGVVTLFGSTDPVWAQIDYPRERIVRVDVPCSPCQQKVCPMPAGPEHHQCMTAITPEMVLAAAEELLAEGRVAPAEAKA